MPAIASGERFPAARPRWISSPLRGREIRLACPDGHFRPVHADLDPMRLAVEHRRRKSEQVLMVQFLGDALERRREIVGVRQLEIAAARFRGNLGQARVWFVERTAAEAAWRPSATATTSPTGTTETAGATAARPAPPAETPGAVRTRQPDGVDHDVFFVGPLHHVFEAAAVGPGGERGVDTVGEHENDATAFFVKKSGDAHTDGVPEWRRPFLVKLRGST